MSKFHAGTKTLERLKGVHPDLVRVVMRAFELTTVDFTIPHQGGKRTLAEQREIVARGASKTLDSPHVTGDAVDIAPWIDGKIAWSNMVAFQEIAEAMFAAADELGVLIQWGADWDLDGIRVDRDSDESFLDMPHFQRPKVFRLQAAKAAAQRRMRLREMGAGDIL